MWLTAASFREAFPLDCGLWADGRTIASGFRSFGLVGHHFRHFWEAPPPSKLQGSKVSSLQGLKGQAPLPDATTASLNDPIPKPVSSLNEPCTAGTLGHQPGGIPL